MQYISYQWPVTWLRLDAKDSNGGHLKEYGSIILLRNYKNLLLIRAIVSALVTILGISVSDPLCFWLQDQLGSATLICRWAEAWPATKKLSISSCKTTNEDGIEGSKIQTHVTRVWHWDGPNFSTGLLPIRSSSKTTPKA